MNELDRIYEDIEIILNEAKKIVIDLNDKKTFASYVNQAIDSSANQQMQVDKNIDWSKYFNKANATGSVFRSTLTNQLYDYFTKKRNDEAQTNGTQPNMTVTYSEIFQSVKPEVKKVADINRQKLQQKSEPQQQEQTPQEPVASQETTSSQNSSSSIKDTEDATLDLLGEYEDKLAQSNQTIQQLQAQIAEIQKSLQTAAPQDKENLENQEAQAEAQLAQAQKEKENAEEKINQAKESDNTEGTNNSVNLNHRFNDVIESPQIQAEINKEQEPITSIEISDGGNNQQKISIMGEKYSTPIEIPEFISRYFEAKELGSLNAGNSTSLNPYLSKEIQTQLASQGKEITKLLLSTDGEVLFLDKTGRQIMIDKPEEHSEKEGETSQSNPDNGREISHAVTVTELNNLAIEAKKKMGDIKDGISSDIENLLKEEKLDKAYKFEVNSINLGKVLEGTYLNESKTDEMQEISLKEAESQVKKNTETETSDSETKASPKKEVSGDCEIYVMEEFTVTKAKAPENPTKNTVDNNEKKDKEDTQSAQSENKAENKEESEQEKAEKEKKILSDLIQNILAVSKKKTIDILNGEAGGITLTVETKTKDEGTFTGNSKQIQTTKFTFTAGRDNLTGYEAIDENSGKYKYKAWFTIIVKKGNSNTRDSFGTKFNRFGQMLTGLGDMSAKLGMNGKSGLNSVTL